MNDAIKDQAANWIDDARCQLALRNTFGGNVPVLDGLHLAQLLIGECGEVQIALNFPTLPEGSPARWSNKGYDRVQLRLSFYDPSRLSITGTATGISYDLSASFGPDKTFSMSHADFHVELDYFSASADWYPYDSRIFEEPRAWYHR